MFHSLPDSDWADENLAEAARQLGKMVEQPNQSQPNPGLRADGTPCKMADTNLNVMSQAKLIWQLTFLWKI